MEKVLTLEYCIFCGGYFPVKEGDPLFNLLKDNKTNEQGKTPICPECIIDNRKIGFFNARLSFTASLPA